MTATHPSDRELDEFLLGKFPDPDHVAVEEHLAGCPGCQERAADRTAGDTLTELLAAARTRADADRAAASTPAPAGSATPSLFAPTQDGTTAPRSRCAATTSHPHWSHTRSTASSAGSGPAAWA